MEEEKIEQLDERLEEDSLEARKAQFIAAVKSAISVFPGHPSEEELGKMKETYGEVFASGIDDEEIYLFRPLSRKEYLMIKRQVGEMELLSQEALSQGKEPVPTDGLFEEEVVNTCVLWASKPKAIESKAGTLDVLFEQIMLNSNFMHPNNAAQLVIKL